MDYELSREFQCYAALIDINQLLEEMADITGAVRTLSMGITTLKQLGDLAVKSQNLELQEGILNLRQELMTLKNSLLDVEDENLELRKENISLKRKIAELETPSVEPLIARGEFYYTLDGNIPYCPQCWEGEGKKVRLSQVGPIHICSASCGYKKY